MNLFGRVASSSQTMRAKSARGHATSAYTRCLVQDLASNNFPQKYRRSTHNIELRYARDSEDWWKTTVCALYQEMRELWKALSSTGLFRLTMPDTVWIPIDGD